MYERTIISEHIKEIARAAPQHYTVNNKGEVHTSIKVFDDVDEAEILRWFKADDPLYAYTVHRNNIYAAEIRTALEQFTEMLDQHWALADLPFAQNKEEIANEVSDIFYVDPEPCQLLKREIRCCIKVDTGDSKGGYKDNTVYPHRNAKFGDPISCNASILWLAQQQGYSKSQLNNALRLDACGGSKLLSSLRAEIASSTGDANTLTFFAMLTMRQLLEANEALARPAIENRLHFLPIHKSTPCGLYDHQTGEGGALSIELEHDVILPVKYIGSIMPDKVSAGSVSRCRSLNEAFWKSNTVQSIKKKSEIDDWEIDDL